LASKKGFKRPAPNPWVTWKIENGKLDLIDNLSFYFPFPIFPIFHFL
jgi:hypothetical protein